MSDPQVRVRSSGAGAESVDDIEMEGDDVEITDVVETGTGEEEEEKVSIRTTFIEYLKSPVMEISVGTGDTQTLLTAHKGLLVRSPYFAQVISEDPTKKKVEMPTENLDAVGSFLEYLYTGEYFPRIIGEGREATLESDPNVPSKDESGEHLLRHGRVYTLADKLGMKELKSLAHSKVHRADTNAKGEIAYARYVYGNTPREDVTIRKPIASFWGMRAYVLRHDAEDDFKALCLEYPEFGFDVLSFVLDARERKASERQTEEPRSGRKRPRI